MLKRIKKRHWIIGGAALIITVLVLSIIHIATTDPMDDNPIPLENPTEIYAQAVSKLNDQENLHYRISGTKETFNGNTVLTESFTQTITHEALNSGALRSCVEQTLNIGSYVIQSVDYFADDTQFRTIQDAGFFAPMTADEFTAQYPPAAPIESKHYAEITGVRRAGESTISFTQPAAIETWAVDGSAELISAEGNAVIDRDGNLMKSSYTVDYKLGGVSFKIHITAEVLAHENTTIQAPDTSAHKPISDIDIPFMLEKACGYLMNADSISAEYTDTIFCQAFGDERNQMIQLITQITDQWTAQVDTNVSVSNSSKAGVVSTHSKSELFTDNHYLSAVDNGQYVENPEVDIETMKRYCQNLLIGTIMLPQDIADADLQKLDDIYCITFKASEGFAQVLAEEACETLYQKPSILKDLAQSSATDTVTCYLNVDKYTGLPVSSGFYYQGTYTISDLPYQLCFRADQTYTQPE